MSSAEARQRKKQRNKMEKYEEIRLEVTAGELLKALQETGRAPGAGYKHNNTLIPGHKDIGLNGWITFVLRKQEDKNATENKTKVRSD